MNNIKERKTPIPFNHANFSYDWKKLKYISKNKSFHLLPEYEANFEYFKTIDKIIRFWVQYIFGKAISFSMTEEAIWTTFVLKNRWK